MCFFPSILSDLTYLDSCHLVHHPLKQHAWDESIRQFVEAIERSKQKGPFWVCAFSIYQNDVIAKGVTIAQQLGSDLEWGPFVTVLREVDLMLVLLTDECDIYTQLWYVHG